MRTRLRPRPRRYQTTIESSRTTRWIRRTRCLAAGLVLAGCARTPTPTPEPPAPVAAVPFAPAERAEVFVPEVAVPNPAATTEVTLPQLLAYADANAPAIRLARARAARADAEVAAARPLLRRNPFVNLALGARTIGPDAYLETEVTVRQPLEIAGERGLRLRAAEQARKVARAGLDEVRWALHVQVHRLFLDALLARERARVADRVVAFAEDLDRIAAQRIAAGEAPPLDRLVSRTDLARAREQRVEAHRRAEAAAIRLAEVVGWPPDRTLVPAGTLPPIRRARPASDLAQLAAQHHPSFRTRALVVDAAHADVRRARREAWPEPTVGFTYGREGGPAPNDNIWLFTLRLPVPLWNRNQGDRARAAADLEIARTERRVLHVQWRRRLERAAAAVDAAAARVEIYGHDVLPSVERNLALLRRAFELGEIDLLTVSQTRERLLASQAQALDARGAYGQALADLEALVGTEVDQALEAGHDHPVQGPADLGPPPRPPASPRPEGPGTDAAAPATATESAPPRRPPREVAP